MQGASELSESEPVRAPRGLILEPAVPQGWDGEGDDPLDLTALLAREPAPRLLALYVISGGGLAAARVERPGFSEDPAILAMMLGAVAQFVRDEISKKGRGEERGILRVAEGAKGFCVVPSETFGLVAVFESRETARLLRDLAGLAASIETLAGRRLRDWDGERRAMGPVEAAMEAFLHSGRWDGAAAPSVDPVSNDLVEVLRQSGLIPAAVPREAGPGARRSIAPLCN